MSSRMERPRREVVLAMAHEGYARKYPKGRSSAPAPKNVGPMLRLLGKDHLVVPFGGRGYELGYVSFEDGMRLAGAKGAVEALETADPTPENQKAYLEAMRLIVRIAPRYLRPVEPVRRFFWPLRLLLRGNPFRKMTDAEVGQLLGFFIVSRTRSRVRFPTPAPGAPDPTS